MRIEVLQESFKRTLAVVMPAVAGKSTLPVLSHIQLTATEDGRLALAATNLECGITTSIGARVENAGSVCLPSKLLSDLIGGLPNVPIALELDSRTQIVKIRAEKIKSELHGLSGDEFPVLVTTGSDPLFAMPVADWYLIASTVAPMASDNSGQPILSGVHISGKDRLVFEAADSFRLSRKTFDQDGAGIDTIIPATALTTARKVFSGDASVSLSTANSGALVLLSDGTTTFTSRVIEGSYPDLDRMIPVKYTSRIILPAADILATLRLAKPFAEANANVVRLDLAEMVDMEGKLVIASKASEIGEHSSVLDVLATGKPTKIALNINFLIEAVAACGSGDIAIELRSERSPAVIKPVSDDSMLQLVMDMSIRD